MQFLFQAQAKADLVQVEALHAGHRVDVYGDDLLGALGRHFLDFHAAGLAADYGNRCGGAVGDDGEIQLLLDVEAFLNQHLAHQFAFRACLFGDELHADNGIGNRFDIGPGLGQLDAAALAAAARMHLGFDDDRQPEFIGNLFDFR